MADDDDEDRSVTLTAGDTGSTAATVTAPRQPGWSRTYVRGPTDGDWGGPGQVNRSWQVQQLKDNPQLLKRLHDMIHGEVSGSSSPEARRIQMESAFNRAGERGHSMEQVLRTTYRIGDSGYYPPSTYGHNPSSYDNYSKEDFAADLNAVAAGSNYGGKYMPEGVLHTGNASGGLAQRDFARGKTGFSFRTAGGIESYFNEEGARGVRAARLQTQVGGSPEDMTDRYNTPLTPEQKTAFDSWAKGQGRNMDEEKYDYDIQGAWLAGDHSDRFKKPNHMTFSEDSQYSGQDGYRGGHWTPQGQGWQFQPSEDNLNQHSPVQMAGYLSHVSGAKLKMADRPVQRGLLDWFRSKPQEPEAEPAKPPLQDQINTLLKGGEFPTEAEAAQGAEFNRPGQTGAEARVLGQMMEYNLPPTKDKKGRLVQRSAREFMPGEITGMKESEAAATGDDPTKSFTMDLTDPANAAVAKVARPVIQQAARAVNRSALATLGFDPHHTALEVMGNQYGVGGLTQGIRGGRKGPTGKGIEGESIASWVNTGGGASGAMVHESIHRGMDMLEERQPEEFKKTMAQLKDVQPFNTYKTADLEELVVRQIMRTAMGDIESKNPRAHTGQIGAAKLMFEDAPNAPKATRLLQHLEKMASEEVGKRLVGGPH